MRQPKYIKDTDFGQILKDVASVIVESDDMDEEKKINFINNIMTMAKCYTKGTSMMCALVFPLSEDSIAISAVNANQMDIADMIAKAYLAVQHMVMEDAPEKGMFN